MAAPTLPRVSLALAAFLFALAPALTVSAPSARAAEERSVPDVTGKPVEDAADALRRAGFGMRVIEVAGPDAGRISEQDPLAGQVLGAGATVTVRVGVTARVKTTMPNVVGLPPEDALAALGRAYDVRVTRVEVPAERAGRVLATRPSAGDETLFRAQVYVVVGVLGGSRTLPGDPGTPEANENLLNAPAGSNGPSLGPVVPVEPAPVPVQPPRGDVPPTQLPPPAVVPGAGTPPAVAPGAGTPPVVAARPDMKLPESDMPIGSRVRVPDVMGKPEDEAMRTLARIGLRPEVLRVDDASVPQGVVLLQMPIAGSEATAGGDAYLKVAGGTARPTVPEALPEAQLPPVGDGGFADAAPGYGTLPPAGAGNGTPPGAPTIPDVVPAGMSPTPDLIGMDVTQATAKIIEGNLVPHPWYVVRDGLPAWTVIAQKDAAGTPIAQGDVVNFRVVLPLDREGTVPMPSLFGLNKEQATNVLRGLGMPLRARLVDPAGKVTLQRPLAGSQIPWGSPVGIVVGPIDDPQRIQSTPEIELISEEAAVIPPAAAPEPAPKKKRKKNIFDRIGDFIDDAADEVRDAVR
ncbi:MAG: PASTA domain-containing protein [Planctomycetota bacterium]